jgi:NAD(P)-dependent dehydrogenase (short-subunit alcohol dehydrogenase family)
MTEIANRTTLITGGAQGIGLGMARAFAKAGARLALIDIDDVALTAARKELSLLTDLRTYALDVRDREGYELVAQEVEVSLGQVTILCNNAGVAPGRTMIRDMSYPTWDWALGINLGGVVNGIQTFVPGMIGGGGGHIVNTASAAGVVVPGPAAGGGSGYLYHTAKYAVVGLSESLRNELAEFSIGVSVLCPGAVATDILDNTLGTRPSNVARPIDEIWRQRRASIARGLHPDAVGQLVVEAVQENRLYIHTDRTVEDFVRARAETIVAAMPQHEVDQKT